MAVIGYMIADAATETDPERRFNVRQSKMSGLAGDVELAAASASPTLDADTERAVRRFIQHLKGKYDVLESVVFGSRARGTHSADSDADVAVILKGEHGDRYRVAGDMAAIAFDVMLETDVRVDPLPLWEGEFRQPERFSNPALIEAIKREGHRL